MQDLKEVDLREADLVEEDSTAAADTARIAAMLNSLDEKVLYVYVLGGGRVRAVVCVCVCVCVHSTAPMYMLVGNTFSRWYCVQSELSNFCHL